MTFQAFAWLSLLKHGILVVCQKRGNPNKPQDAIVLIALTPPKSTLNFGKPPLVSGRIQQLVAKASRDGFSQQSVIPRTILLNSKMTVFKGSSHCSLTRQFWGGYGKTRPLLGIAASVALPTHILRCYHEQYLATGSGRDLG